MSLLHVRRQAPTIADGQYCRISAFPSALGWMAAAWSDNWLHELTFGHRSARAALTALAYRGEKAPLDLVVNGLAKRLQAHAAGRHDEFLDVQVDLTGLTNFQRSVIDCCRRIPRGGTLTYAQLAARVGSPRAARAVGNVMAANRFPLVVPCHRVVGSTGSLGGFSGPEGVRMKRRLLELEGSLGGLQRLKRSFSAPPGALGER